MSLLLRPRVAVRVMRAKLHRSAAQSGVIVAQAQRIATRSPSGSQKVAVALNPRSSRHRNRHLIQLWRRRQLPRLRQRRRQRLRQRKLPHRRQLRQLQLLQRQRWRQLRQLPQRRQGVRHFHAQSGGQVVRVVRSSGARHTNPKRHVRQPFVR